MTLLKLKANGYKGAVTNKHLVEIIEKTISSYPLSLVNLQRLRKDVDSLNELFWIKDGDGNYLLVNNKFASRFHLNPSQIEGKAEDKFIPAYLINFNKALEDYIRESGSVLIVEGFPLSAVPAGDQYQIIEIPVSGSEGSLDAIIGVVQKSGREDETDDFSSSLLPFKNILKNYLIINNENKITEVSREFCTIFSLEYNEVKG
jgi:PAS domain-containing protein